MLVETAPIELILAFIFSTTSFRNCSSNTDKNAPTSLSSAASNVASAWMNSSRSMQPEQNEQVSLGISVFGQIVR